MRTDVFVRNLRMVLLLAVIVAIIAGILYLIYGFTILWQALAAGIIIGFLSILVIIFVGVSIYFWTRNLLLKRELRRYEMELRQCRAELKKKIDSDNEYTEFNR